MEYEKFTVRLPRETVAKLKRHVAHAQIEEQGASLETAVQLGVDLYCLHITEAYGEPDPMQIVNLIRGRRPGNPGAPRKPKLVAVPEPEVADEAPL